MGELCTTAKASFKKDALSPHQISTLENLTHCFCDATILIGHISRNPRRPHLRQLSLEELDRIRDHTSARVHDVLAPGLNIASILRSIHHAIRCYTMLHDATRCYTMLKTMDTMLQRHTHTPMAMRGLCMRVCTTEASATCTPVHTIAHQHMFSTVFGILRAQKARL